MMLITGIPSTDIHNKFHVTAVGGLGTEVQMRIALLEIRSVTDVVLLDISRNAVKHSSRNMKIDKNGLPPQKRPGTCQYC